MDNIILDLNQQQSKSVKNNGDWTTNLSKEVKVNEGDEIHLKTAFFDTISTSSGKIILSQDLTLKMGVCMFQTNWNNTEKTYDPASSADGDYYIANRFSAVPGSGGGSPSNLFYKVTKQEFRMAGDPQPDWGGGYATYSYDDLNGDKKYVNVSVPVENKFRSSEVEVSVNIICAIGSWKYVGGLGSDTARGETTTAPVTTGAITFEPIVNDFTITLPKGDYDPDTLALKISEACSINQPSPNLVSSAFLNGHKDLTANLVFINSGTGNKTYKYAPSVSGNYYVGSSQVQLLFDKDIQNGSEISVRYIDYSGTIKGTTANGGCFFQYLYATNADGTHSNFWSDTLGFNLTTLCPVFQHVKKTVGTYTDAEFSEVTLTVGENITRGFNGLDSVVNKKYTAGPPVVENWAIEPTLPFVSTLNASYEILASKSFEDIDVTTSHFLLEVNSNFRTDFRNEIQTKSTISAIISRYYGYQSFTSSQGEGSISYTHKGEPVFLKSLSVRVLNPDLTLASIGPRNHVYLQVVKPLITQQQEQQLEQEEKKISKN
jgi:hypothetical protein